MKSLKDNIVIITSIILALAALTSLFLSSHIFKQTNKITHLSIRPRMNLINVDYSRNNIQSVLDSKDKDFYTNFHFQNIGKTEARNVKMTIITTQDKNFKKISKPPQIKHTINPIQPGQPYSEQRIDTLKYIDSESIEKYFIKTKKNLPMIYYYLKLEYEGEDNVFDESYCQEFWIHTSLNKEYFFQPILTSTKQTSSFQKLINNRCNN